MYNSPDFQRRAVRSAELEHRNARVVLNGGDGAVGKQGRCGNAESLLKGSTDEEPEE